MPKKNAKETITYADSGVDIKAGEEAVERIKDLARQTFALTIRAIVSQQILPSIKEGVARIPAIEILIANPIVRKLISEGRESDLPAVIRSCQGEGMQDFTESLRSLVEKEFIDLKVALQFAPNVEELKMALKGIRTSSSGIL